MGGPWHLARTWRHRWRADGRGACQRPPQPTSAVRSPAQGWEAAAHAPPPPAPTPDVGLQRPRHEEWRRRRSAHVRSPSRRPWVRATNPEVVGPSPDECAIQPDSDHVCASKAGFKCGGRCQRATLRHAGVISALPPCQALANALFLGADGGGSRSASILSETRFATTTEGTEARCALTIGSSKHARTPMIDVEI